MKFMVWLGLRLALVEVLMNLKRFIADPGRIGAVGFLVKRSLSFPGPQLVPQKSSGATKSLSLLGNPLAFHRAVESHPTPNWQASVGTDEVSRGRFPAL